MRVRTNQKASINFGDAIKNITICVPCGEKKNDVPRLSKFDPRQA